MKVHGKLVDISSRGARIDTPWPLSVGDRIHLHVADDMRIQAIVIWAREAMDGTTGQLGCQFLSSSRL